MKKEMKEAIAARVAEAITMAYHRTGEMPSEKDLQEAIMYVLEDEDTKSRMG